MKMPVQAVELTQYGSDGLSPLFGIAAGDQHFDAGGIWQTLWVCFCGGNHL
jgi:hypothetical protein